MRRLAFAVVLLAALLLPGVARAGWDQESMFQDDNLLLYSPPNTVAATLDTLKTLGVDRVRVTVKWSSIAPSPDSDTRPNFDSNDPNAYPSGAWDRYDTVVELAQARGIGVDFNVTAPAPDWATSPSPTAAERDVYNPSPQEFQTFVHAVGLRYSGTFRPSTTTTTGGSGGLSGLLGGGGGTTTTTTGDPLPRVSYWSIWNEPNQPGWLLPQSAQTGGTWVDQAPRLYRGLVDAAFSSLYATGHPQDVILIGETAPQGVNDPGITNGLFPLRFIRDLYCVNRKFKPLTGSLADALGCPADGNTAQFVKDHPDLFTTTGYAHHPYSLVFAPDYRALQPDSVGLADVHSLEHTLDRVFRTYAQRRKLGIYLTEYGYQTKPPDPDVPFSPTQQAAYLNQADYMTFQDSRVKTLSQFQLQDDLPNQQVPKNSRFYWSTFQSGLEYHGGRHKPSFAAYRLPIWVPRTRGTVLRVWGLLRPAVNGARQTVQIQYRRGGTTAWMTMHSLRVSSPRGSFLTRIHPPKGAGLVRLAWKGMYSRTVAVRGT